MTAKEFYQYITAHYLTKSNLGIYVSLQEQVNAFYELLLHSKHNHMKVQNYYNFFNFTHPFFTTTINCEFYLKYAPVPKLFPLLT